MSFKQVLSGFMYLVYTQVAYLILTFINYLVPEAIVQIHYAHQPNLHLPWNLIYPFQELVTEIHQIVDNRQRCREIQNQIICQDHQRQAYLVCCHLYQNVS